MDRSWDERKNQINKRRHKLSFELAWLIFEDPFALTTEDYVDENGEMRYQTIGFAQGVLITIGHIYRIIDGIETPWIITARKAVKYEQQVYWSRRGKN